MAGGAFLAFTRTVILYLALGIVFRYLLSDPPEPVIAPTTGAGLSPDVLVGVYLAWILNRTGRYLDSRYEIGRAHV